MPVYPLVCEQCGNKLDIVRSAAECSDPYPCKCGGNMRQNYAEKFIQKAPFFEGAFIFKDGKKIHLATKEACQEHAARNNLIMGADDLEQQAEYNKQQIAKETEDKTTEKVIEGMKRKKIIGDITL